MDERSDQLRALKQVIEACRVKAADAGMPALTHILRRAERSLADHAAHAEIPRGPALSVPRLPPVRH